MRAIHFSGCVDPGGHPAGSENGRQKKRRRAAAAVSGMMGYLQRLFTWIEPEKEGLGRSIKNMSFLKRICMQLAKMIVMRVR